MSVISRFLSFFGGLEAIRGAKVRFQYSCQYRIKRQNVLKKDDWAIFAGENMASVRGKGRPF
jgi:hypothetical protein